MECGGIMPILFGNHNLLGQPFRKRFKWAKTTNNLLGQPFRKRFKWAKTTNEAYTTKAGSIDFIKRLSFLYFIYI